MGYFLFLSIGIVMMFVAFWNIMVPALINRYSEKDNRPMKHAVYVAVTCLVISVCGATGWGLYQDVNTYGYDYWYPFIVFTGLFGFLLLESAISFFYTYMKNSETFKVKDTDAVYESMVWMFWLFNAVAFGILGVINVGYVIVGSETTFARFNVSSSYAATESQVSLTYTFFVLLSIYHFAGFLTYVLILMANMEIGKAKLHYLGNVILFTTGSWYILIACVLYTSLGTSTVWNLIMLLFLFVALMVLAAMFLIIVNAFIYQCFNSSANEGDFFQLSLPRKFREDKKEPPFAKPVDMEKT